MRYETDFDDTIVAEYGFSNAINENAPDGYKTIQQFGASIRKRLHNYFVENGIYQ